MLTIKEATSLIKSNIPNRQSILVALNDCLGLYLAEDVTAPEASPRYTNSAMDGYAIKFVDGISPDQLFKIVGESQAGAPFSGVLGENEAIRINTGAAVPESADTVIRLEDTEEINSLLKINILPNKPGKDVRYKGEEFEQGKVILKKGTCLLAPQIALLAAVGFDKFSVYKPCEITLIITGSELVSSGSKPSEFQIRDSNMAMLVAAILEAGGKVVKTVRVPDDQDITRQAIAEATTDIVICTGGVSVGKHDHVKSSVEFNGYKEIFWRIKQKPGKPLFFAKKDSTLLFGLPGNPVSAFMCFTHYIRPVIGYLNGLNFGWPMVAGVALADIKNDGKRTCMIRVKLSWHPNSGYSIKDAVAQGSHMLTSISESDGYIILEPGDLLQKGSTIDVYCYNTLKEIF
ncbi:MAG: molybdopterin molybdotransferase MoeA [Desulfotalea sp.]